MRRPYDDQEDTRLPMVITEATWTPDSATIPPLVPAQTREHEEQKLAEMINDLQRRKIIVDEAVPAKDLFPFADLILHLSQIPIQHISVTDLQNKQLHAIETRAENLAKQVSYNLIEMGMLIVEGDRICLPQLLGHKNMMEWMVCGPKISPDLIRMAVDRYNLYCFVQPFDVKPSELANLESAKLRRLRSMQADVIRQTNILAKQHVIEYLQERGEGGEEERLSLAEVCAQLDFKKVMEKVPVSEREAVYSEATGATKAMLTADIRHILASDPADLLQEDAQRGEVIKPTFTLNVDFDPLTGHITFRGDAFVEQGNLTAMGKGQVTWKFNIKSPIDAEMPPGPLSLQDLALHLDKHLDTY